MIFVTQRIGPVGSAVAPVEGGWILELDRGPGPLVVNDFTVGKQKGDEIVHPWTRCESR